MQTLFSLITSIQQKLFPFIEENISPLTEKEREFVRAAELASVGKYSKALKKWIGNGRKPHNRKAIALAFIAKAVWNLPTTLLLINFLKSNQTLRMLCGWEWASDLPSESTFSRAFAEFSESGLTELMHKGMVAANMEGMMACHISTDSTAIEAREKPAKKPKKESKEKRKRGRAKKGEARAPIPPGRIRIQIGRSLAENLASLPKQCDRGVKRGSSGNAKIWTGFKLHWGVADGDIPISVLLTSASLHDSQAAVPLMQMASARMPYCYDLADSAYDAKAIKEYSRSLGHVPIIDSNKRRGDKKQMCPAKKTRYKERGAVERAFSNLKDNYGGRFIRVKGAAKVMAHLMFGVLALTAAQLCRLVE